MRLRSLLIVLAACATGSPAQPTTATSRGLRVDAHLAAAREHDARAAQLSRWPERRLDPVGFDDPSSGLWYRAFDTMRDEERMAAAHRSEAARLQAEYDEACAGVASADISTSLLQRYAVGAIPTLNGAVIVLTNKAGPPARLVAALRCHRAWMMLGEAGMDSCPLDLPGIQLQAYGDDTGISVEISTRNAELVPEVQRRAAAHAMHGEGL